MCTLCVAPRNRPEIACWKWSAMQGALRTGHRALGEALGISATRAGQLLRDLVADGAIRVRVGKTVSVITLVPIGH